jgi:hypothetical protein
MLPAAARCGRYLVGAFGRAALGSESSHVGTLPENTAGRDIPGALATAFRAIGNDTCGDVTQCCPLSVFTCASEGRLSHVRVCVLPVQRVHCLRGATGGAQRH